MNESIIISDKVSEQIVAKAVLVGLGIQIRRLGILKIIEKEVKIGQKTVKYTPHEKLTDALIAILSGAKVLVDGAILTAKARAAWLSGKCQSLLKTRSRLHLAV